MTVEQKEQLRKEFENTTTIKSMIASETLVNVEIDWIFNWFCQRIEEKDQEIENLKSVMVAAAEEIMRVWTAHCDAEGYGPANLMHRLEKGIAANYPGYKPGNITKMESKLQAQEELIKAADEVIVLQLEKDNNKGWLESSKFDKLIQLKIKYNTLKQKQST